MDERQLKIASKSWAATVVITYLYLTVEIIYKHITTKDIANCTWEVVLILLMTAVLIVTQRTDEAVSLPRKLNGTEVSIELNRTGKLARLRHYLIDALIASVAMTLVEVILSKITKTPIGIHFQAYGQSGLTSWIIGVGIELVILFLISFMLRYIWVEYKVKKYNKQLEQLEDD